jgi:hypothetical protein
MLTHVRFLVLVQLLNVCGGLQSLDYTTLRLSTAELSHLFVPSLVETVVQDDEHSVALCLKTKTRTQLPPWLTLCWHPSYARIGPCQPASGKEFSFGSTLRAALKGLTITSISMPQPYERIVELELKERLSDLEPKYRLVLEVSSSRSNVILVSHRDNSIYAVGRQVAASKSVRPLQTQGQYLPPPSSAGVFIPSPSLPLDVFAQRLLSLSLSSSPSLSPPSTPQPTNPKHTSQPTVPPHQAKLRSQDATHSGGRYIPNPRQGGKEIHPRSMRNIPFLRTRR